MAQPALHYAVGMTCGTVLSLLAPPVRRRWHRWGPLMATASGVWACLPDVDRIWNVLRWLPGTETVGNLENSHAYAVLSNVFFFHGLLDRWYSGQGTIVGLVYVVGLYAVFFWLLGRRIARLERSAREATP